MATKKTNTKKSTFVPEIVIDLTDAKSSSDVYVSFAKAKCDKYMSSTEYDALTYRLGFTVYFCHRGDTCPWCKKKPNLVKRVWNWITRKK